jgi:hypothetical protein
MFRLLYQLEYTEIIAPPQKKGGHVVAQLVEALRHKPEGSIPDGFIGIFH